MRLLREQGNRGDKPVRRHYRQHLKVPRDIFGEDSKHSFNPEPRFDSRAVTGSAPGRWWMSLTGWGKLAVLATIAVFIAAFATFIYSIDFR